MRLQKELVEVMDTNRPLLNAHQMGCQEVKAFVNVSLVIE